MKSDSVSLRMIIGTVLALLTLAAMVPARATAAPLEQQLRLGYETMAASPVAAAPAALTGLELFVLAETLQDLDESDQAAAVQAYLKEYLPEHPLAALLAAMPEETQALPHYESSPDFSRLIRSSYSHISGNAGWAKEGQPLAQLCRVWVGAASEWEQAKALNDFLRQYPDSALSGWAAYRLAWIEWQEHAGSLAGFNALNTVHPQHPLGQEAAAIAEVPFFSPRSLSRQSALIPGWGEETLEPGLKESSSQFYTEVLFLTGSIGFFAASQRDHRQENLLGALIFMNLLIQNHQGSAERTFRLAQRRNLAEQNRFISDHAATSVWGQDTFAPREFSPVPDSDQSLALSAMWQTRGVADGLVKTGWIKNDELANVGLRLEYAWPLAEWQWAEALTGRLVNLPSAHFFTNQAHENFGQDWPGGLNVLEMVLADEVGLQVHWNFGESWVHLRASAGPGGQRRWFQLGPYNYQENKLALAATASLDWGGASGSYWHLAGVYTDTFQTEMINIQQQDISIPSSSMGLLFGLGIPF